MKYITAIAFSLCLVASGAHAQGWGQALAAFGAFSQGYQNGQAQQYNMQHGYPAQIYQPSYGNQSQPSFYILNGRTITCFPMGNFVTCQ